MKISVCTPTLSGKEWEYIKECLDTNWISSKGKFIEKFEEEFSKYCGAKYGVTTTSGTTALHLAIASTNIGPGDEIILPAFTMIATSFPVIYAGATPVLVDAEARTWNMDVNKIEEKITSKTKAIVPVHIYGHPVDMDPIIELAKDHNLYIIEDAAEAHGAEYKGRKAGALGDVGCFSFYANKIITTGEGGMIVTNDEEIYERAKLLKDLAFIKERRFVHHHVGFNYRMTNLQAAIGLAQFEKIEKLAKARRKNAQLYNKFLKNVDGVVLPPEERRVTNVYWMYSVLIKENEFGMTRDELMVRLSEKGIETRPFFVSMHQQPVFREMGLFKNEKYPVAEELSRRGVNLPSSSSLTGEQIKYIYNSIKEIRESGRK